MQGVLRRGARYEDGWEGRDSEDEAQMTIFVSGPVEWSRARLTFGALTVR